MSLLQCHNPIAQRMAAQAACATISESSPDYAHPGPGMALPSHHELGGAVGHSSVSSNIPGLLSMEDPMQAMQSTLGFVPAALEMLRRKPHPPPAAPGTLSARHTLRVSCGLK